MTNEQAYVEGFCKAAEVAGVDPVGLAKVAAPVGLLGRGFNAGRRYLSLLRGGNVSALEGRLAQANRVIERAGNNMAASKMLGARQMHGANQGIMAGAKRMAAKSQAALDAERGAVSQARLLTGVGAGGVAAGGAAGALAAGGGVDPGEQNVHTAEALSLVIKRAEAIKRANAVKRAAGVLDALIGDKNGNPGILSRALANEHLRRAAVGALATGTTAALASDKHKLRNALLAAGAGGLAAYGASATGALDNALTPFKPVNDVTRASGRAVASREIARKLRKPNPDAPYEQVRAAGNRYFSDPGVQKAYADAVAQIR